MKIKPSIIALSISLAVATVATTTYAENQKFYDRESLITTLTVDDQAELDAATANFEAASVAVDDAQAALDTANLALADFEASARDALAEAELLQAEAQSALDTASATATAEEMTALQTALEEAVLAVSEATQALEALDTTELQEEVTAAQGSLEDALSIQSAAETELEIIQAEFDATGTLVGELSEDQVFALNRSLNNAVKSNLIVDFDSEQLQMLLDGSYDKRQINALTQALEQSARFELKAEALLAEYEATGDEELLREAEHMQAKGESQEQKFLAKVDRFGGVSGKVDATSKQAAKAAAKQESRAAAKGASKQLAKDQAKGAAKAAAKAAAKSAAKQAAKSAAKNAAKKAAKRAARAG